MPTPFPKEVAAEADAVLVAAHLVVRRGARAEEAEVRGTGFDQQRMSQRQSSATARPSPLCAESVLTCGTLSNG